MLVEVSDLQACADHHLPAGRREFAQDQLEKRALARAVGADDADPIAAQDARR